MPRSQHKRIGTKVVAGLDSYNAAFCIGERFGGAASVAALANGCIASSGTDVITYKYNMP